MSNSGNLTNVEPFLWGVSTSGYQHEGGYNDRGQPYNNWGWWEQQNLVERTGTAAEFWQRYETDFQLCQSMGLNSFRLSIEWARVQPTYNTEITRPPEFDSQALDDYSDRLAACRRYGLEPLVTLHHFTHPAWLGKDAWLDTRTLDAYLNFVATTVTHINRRLVDLHQLPPIRWYITINEPNILVTNTYLKGDFPGNSRGVASALRAYNHLLCAHIRAYNLIHDLYESEGWLAPRVSFNTYCSDLYWSEKVIWDLLFSREKQIANSEIEDYIYQQANQWEKTLSQSNLPFNRDLAYRLGRVLEKSVNWLGRRWFKGKVVEDLLVTLRDSPRDRVFDYLALDYYDPFFAHSLRLPNFTDLELGRDLRSWLMSSISSKWWDWRYLPEGLFFFCQTYAEAFDRPISIAENGMALRRSRNNFVSVIRRDRLDRSQFLIAHINQVKRLQKLGVPILGYFHWSLTDNYEWGSYTPRFGLFGIDFTKNSERLVLDPYGDRPADTYAALIREN
jgi:beta-glucosidase